MNDRRRELVVATDRKGEMEWKELVTILLVIGGAILLFVIVRGILRRGFG